MRRIFITMAVALATFTATQAQEIKFGVKGGINFSTVSVSDYVEKFGGNTYVRSTEAGYRTGFHIAGLAEYQFTDALFVEVGLGYAQQGATLKSETETVKNSSGQVIASNEVKYDDVSTVLDFINLPVWVKYDIQGFRPKAGINFGYMLKAKNVEGSTSESFDPEKKVDFGIGLGAEYHLPMGLFFDASFNLGLANLAEKDSELTTKNRVFQIGVGYKF